jgi:predicted phosphodiesterase
MKRLVTADLQLDATSLNKYRLDFFAEKLPALVQKYAPDQLLVLGDITEQKDYHPAPLVNLIVDTFCHLSELCEEVIILEGNHDYSHAKHPFFSFLNQDNFDRIKWFGGVHEYDNCLFLSHTRNHKEEWKAVRTFEGFDYIFAHNIFTGVKANGQSLSGIPVSIFPDDCCVISGDVHEPQSFDCVTYVGSPYLCNFGDDYVPRVLLLDDLDIKSIKIKGPQKRLIEVYFNQSQDDWVFKGTYDEGDTIKFQVYLKMENVASWAKIRAWVEKWASKRNVIAHSINPIVEYVKGEGSKLVKGSRKSDNDFLDSFVARFGLDEHTAGVGKDLIGD